LSVSGALEPIVDSLPALLAAHTGAIPPLAGGVSLLSVVICSLLVQDADVTAARRARLGHFGPTLGVAAGVGAAAAGVLISWHAPPCPRGAWLALQPVGVCFTATGHRAWRREPSNGTGRLMIAVGITWYIGDLQSSTYRPLSAAGFCGFYLVGAVFAHLVLALPSGRISRLSERIAVLGLYGDSVASQILRYLSEPAPHRQIPARSAHLSIWAPIGGLIGGTLTLVAFLLVVRRLESAGRPTRRVLAVLWSTGGIGGLAALAEVTAGLFNAPTSIQEPLLLTFAVALMCAPFAIWAGLLRVRLARLRVADLVMHLDAASEPARVREALSDALNDPTLEVCFRLPDETGYVDVDGHPTTIPNYSHRAITVVERQGEQLAALIHDPALTDQRPLVDAVVAAARLALQNARLLAAHRAQLQEVRASRLRIVAAADAERNRIQRDLHDGAQHDLLAIAILIGQAREELPDNAELGYLNERLEKAGSRLHDVIRRLRELAEGIDPPALTEQGLAAAVEILAERAPLPVLFNIPSRRWPSPIERTAYFVVNESLANVYKHALASCATVRVWQPDRALALAVRDDGVGGADPALGAGLRGLSDRVTALGGTLRIDSPPGKGTVVEALLPCG
jgi:signal transduction histidine kinase